jgi:hypothetical protein
MAENEIKKIKQVEVGDVLYDVAVKSVDHVEGLKDTLDPIVSSHGEDCIASGDFSHAEGYITTASGIYSHAEGENTTASGYCSHAEGNTTHAKDNHSHAEGVATVASGEGSHAEGEQTAAEGYASHAEGYYTTASGVHSHAEGESTTASGDCSHAEGESTTASGFGSHAGGSYTVAGYDRQTVIGTYNDNKENTLFEVGNGDSEDARSNALEVLADGRVKVYGTPTEDEDVITKKYFEENKGGGGSDVDIEFETEVLSVVNNNPTLS